MSLSFIYFVYRWHRWFSKNVHDFNIFYCVLYITIVSTSLCMVKYWSSANMRIVGKRQQLFSKFCDYGDDDVMGSHASLWLWNQATWEKLNSLLRKERRKIFPDSQSWMRKREKISEMDNLYVIIWIAIYASMKVLGLLEKL